MCGTSPMTLHHAVDYHHLMPSVRAVAGETKRLQLYAERVGSTMAQEVSQ